MSKAKFLILIAILFLTGCRVSGFSVGALKVSTPYGDEYAPMGLVNIEFVDERR